MEVIAGYKILEEVGRGSGATVYKAVQVSLGRTVALKVLHPHLAGASEYLKRFHREAESVANLTHPNIVRIYDIGSEGETYYLAMEYCSGTTLSQILSERHKLDLASANGIVAQVAKALSYIHEHGFVHRDVKPSNIIVDDNGQVKITDLGIARPIEGTGITISGMVLGTPEYMSPEQVKGEKVNASTDIYSLGIVIYEMLTGELPFKAKNAVALGRQHICESPPPPRSVESGISPGIEKVILKTIAKSPEKRYRGCGEFLTDWEEAVKSGGSEKLGRRKQVATYVVVAFLVALISGFLLWKLPGSMYVSSIPRDADIYLDGKRIGVTPEDIAGVHPGKHILTVEKDGYQVHVVELRVSRWKKLSVFVPLQKSANPVAVNLPSQTGEGEDSPSNLDVAEERRNIVATGEKTQLRVVRIPGDEGRIREGSNLIDMEDEVSWETLDTVDFHSGGVFEKEESLSTTLIGSDPGKWIHDDRTEYVPSDGEVMSEIPAEVVDSFAEGNVPVGKISAVNRTTGRVALHIKGVREGDILHVIRRRRFIASIEISRVYRFNTAVGAVTESSKIWRINPGDIVIGD